MEGKNHLKKLNPETKYNLQVFQTTEALHKAATEFIIQKAQKAIVVNGRFTISLSGGKTPQKLFELLAKPDYQDQIDWKNTYVFWGDERCVALDDEQNNGHQAMLLLFNKIDIPIKNIHRIPVNLPPEEAAIEYQKTIKNFFGKKNPRFDLLLLGLGEDGHTASLFPFTKVLDEQNEGIRAVKVEQQKFYRITMTAPLINQSRNIIYLVEGKNKAEIFKNVLLGAYQPKNYPAQLIKPIDGELYWFLDSAAATLVNP